jgi:RNA polymerase sigma-70 factor, ECF subfamily
MPEAAGTDFEAWLAEMRPRLHRYCARMTGSAIDGEDAVQEALLKATRAFPGFAALDEPRAWLFRIAQHCALDLLRARRRRAADDETAMDEIEDPRADGQSRWVARTALRPFMQLTPVQRSCVILMDVLGYALDEIGAITGRSLPAVKAALHRGREALRAAAAAPSTPAPPLPAHERRLLEAYAGHFNARDFDALRALLADEVRLELVARKRLDGKAAVSTYFHNYAGADDWQVEPGLVEGRPALLVYTPGTTEAPRYFVLLGWQDGQLATIRDFRYAAYVAEQAETERLR